MTENCKRIVILHEEVNVMNKPKYFYKSEETFKIFEFISEGPKGRIKKMVEYTYTGTENVFNLAFGDFDEKK